VFLVYVILSSVLMWMRDNDTFSGMNKPAVHCSTTDGSDKTSSHKRSSHKRSDIFLSILYFNGVVV